MADIPLKSDDEMTNDLVGAVENIAQSVKAGSRDFTKSFTGLTTAIKRLQTTLVNAIKSIKVQVVAKPEKVQKPATKDKSTSTKEVVKEPKKVIDFQEKEKIVKEKAREKEIEKRQEKVKPVKISSLIEGINQTGDAWSKMISGVRQSIIDNEKIVKADEEKVKKTGKEGTKEFVGPPKKLFENDENKKKEAVIAADKAATDAKKAQEKKDAADAAKSAQKSLKEKEKAEQDAANAEKTLRTYFRKQEERQANEEAKAANDLIKQQDQAAKELAQANQRTQKELDSMIAGFQNLTPLFRGPLVNYGLKMMAKGIGYKQPKEMSKGGGVSYLADGGDASGPMKPKGTDTQPAMLTPGEFVVKKDAAKDPENRKQLESINSGRNKKKTEYYAAGAIVGAVARTGAASAGGAAASGGAGGAAASGGGGGKIPDLLKSIDFGEFGKKFKDLSSKFPALGIASAGLGIALNSVTQSVKIANQALAVFGPLVAKANPALMQKLEIVMNDLSGVIGRALIPAVEYLSPLLRKYADYVDYSMKKLTPSINKSAVAFDNVVSPLMDLGAVVYSVIGPVFNALATIVVGVSNVLKPIIEFITAFSSALVQTIGVLASPIVSVAMATLSFAFDALTLVIKTTLEIIQTLLGAFVNIVGLIIQGLGEVISYIPLMGDVGKSIAKGGEAISKSGESLKQGKPAEQDRIKKGSSVGAAVREVSSTSIAGVGDEVRKNAMMAASGQKTQEDMLGDISNKLDKNALADAFAEGMKKAKDNKPQTTPPVQIQGKIPGALSKQEQVELGTV